MRINEVKDRRVHVSLDASELVCLGNVMYFYEKHHETDPDASKPGDMFNGLYKQVVTARDLCQYGHLDGHALGDIAAHELAMRPEGDLAHKLDKLGRTQHKKTEDGDG